MQESLKTKEVCRKRVRNEKQEVLLAFAEEGMNAALYWENPDPRTLVNVIPRLPTWVKVCPIFCIL